MYKGGRAKMDGKKVFIGNYIFSFDNKKVNYRIRLL